MTKTSTSLKVVPMHNYHGTKLSTTSELRVVLLSPISGPMETSAFVKSICLFKHIYYTDTKKTPAHQKYMLMRKLN